MAWERGRPARPSLQPQMRPLLERILPESKRRAGVTPALPGQIRTLPKSSLR